MKAHAGGVAAAFVILTMYGLEQLAVIAAMPPEPRTALEVVVAAVIGWGIVYLAPSNTPVGEGQ